MPAYQTVVVGTDGSDSSYLAVDRAARIAADAGATLVIACAYHPARADDVAKASDQLGADVAYQVVGSSPAEESVRTATERARKQGAIKIDTVVVDGEPVPTLTRVVREHAADLLVVGNRGLNSLAGRLLGSVPAEVARKAGVDVLIVHTT
jgi:nucleotide-binding universal stress UspA family protein